MHVSLSCVQASMVLFMDLTHSFINCLSTYLKIFTLPGVLMLLFSLRLVGVKFLLKHLRVNLLSLLKMTIFFSRCSHLLKMATFLFPNSVLIKVGNTIKDFLVHPKDRETIFHKWGLIYRYKSGRVDFEEEYIVKSGRTFAERFKDHMRALTNPSPPQHHWS